MEAAPETVEKKPKPAKKPANVKGNKYNKTLTIAQALAAIAKHKPADIQAAIKAIMAEYNVRGMVIGRLLKMTSYDMSLAINGKYPPKTIKAFQALNFPAPAAVPVDGPLSIDRIKAIIAAVKPSCLAALITELKKRYSLVDVSKLMNCTTEKLIAAEKGEAAPLVMKVFKARLGFPAAITE